MPEALHITRFLPQAQPVREPVTRFGGQPVWLHPAEWPQSPETGRPLQFIGQIDLAQTPLELPLMAYLFLQPYDEEDDAYFEDNWAVITQPRDGTPLSEPTGPTIDDTAWLVETERRDEPSWIEAGTALEDAFETEDEAFEPLAAQWGGTKIGGTLAEGDLPPSAYDMYDLSGGEDRWHLLLQLPETDESVKVNRTRPTRTTPFLIGYGDGGTGYFFLSRDGREARCCWFMN